MVSLLTGDDDVFDYDGFFGEQRTLKERLDSIPPLGPLPTNTIHQLCEKWDTFFGRRDARTAFFKRMDYVDICGVVSRCDVVGESRMLPLMVLDTTIRVADMIVQQHGGGGRKSDLTIDRLLLMVVTFAAQYHQNEVYSRQKKDSWHNLALLVFHALRKTLDPADVFVKSVEGRVRYTGPIRSSNPRMREMQLTYEHESTTEAKKEGLIENMESHVNTHVHEMLTRRRRKQNEAVEEAMRKHAEANSIYAYYNLCYVLTLHPSIPNLDMYKMVHTALVHDKVDMKFGINILRMTFEAFGASGEYFPRVDADVISQVVRLTHCAARGIPIAACVICMTLLMGHGGGQRVFARVANMIKVFHQHTYFAQRGEVAIGLAMWHLLHPTRHIVPEHTASAVQQMCHHYRLAEAFSLSSASRPLDPALRRLDGRE